MHTLTRRAIREDRDFTAPDSLLIRAFARWTSQCRVSSCSYNCSSLRDTLGPRYLLGRYVLSKYTGFSLRIAGLRLQNILPPPPRRSQRDRARMLMRTVPARPSLPVGAIMSGGGARAAYQVGVLRAIAAMLPRGAANPFAIICGTSAGAINATSLASNADRFAAGVARLVKVWGNLHVHDVYRTDLLGIASSVFRCLAALLVKGKHPSEPLSVLDCAPLSSLLGRTIDFRRIQRVIATGHLNALSVTASSYVSGDSVTFYQGNGSQRSWRRAHRVGRPVDIALSHVLASCALPLVFPAVPIEHEHFGDG